MDQSTVSDKIRKYLIFKLDGNEYGIDITKTIKIIETKIKITRVPKTPEYIKGVINLRGEIIPVMDLRKRLELSESDFTKETGIIVLKIDDISIGIIVDSVEEVLELSDSSIEGIANISTDMSLDFISGVGKKDGRIITLFNLEKVLNINKE